eukprot:gene7978-16328_t
MKSFMIKPSVAIKRLLFIIITVYAYIIFTKYLSNLNYSANNALNSANKISSHSTSDALLLSDINSSKSFKSPQSQDSIIDDIRKGNVDILMQEIDHKDLANAELIMPSLTRFFRQRYNYSAPKSLILDIGADIGESSAIFIDLFTPINCIRQYHLYSGLDKEEMQNSISKACARTVVRIIAVEAQHSNIQMMNKRAVGELWNEVGWEAVHTAISKKASPGDTITFYGFQKAGNQRGSLAARVAGPSSQSETVTVQTIDQILQQQTYANTGEIFLLKIDIEGFDSWAIEGSNSTLASGRVKWLIFEYNTQWRASQNTLKRIVHHLYKSLFYECFLIVPSAGLLPLHPPFWDDEFEIWKWSNVLCGRANDYDVNKLFEYVIEGDRLSLIEYLKWKRNVMKIL